MNSFKKLNWVQRTLGLFLALNAALFLLDFFRNFKLYLFFLRGDYPLSVVVMLIFCIYIVLSIGNLIQKRAFIGVTFVLLLNFSLVYCVPLFNNFSSLSVLLRFAFYLTWGVFLFSAVFLYVGLYFLRIQSVTKISKFTVDCPELTLSRKLIKILIVLGCFLIGILPSVYFALGVLGQFAGEAYPLYGMLLIWGAVFYLVKLTHSLCSRDIMKALTIGRFGIFCYAYGLCVVILVSGGAKARIDGEVIWG